MNKLDNLTTEDFKLLYDSMSQKRLAKRLNVTVKTVMKRVDRLMLDKKPKGRPKNTGYLFKDEMQFSPEVQEILNRYDAQLV